jgi:streptomycin 6-kinase
VIPAALASACATDPERGAWLAALPRVIDELSRRWSLLIEAPYQTGTCAFVAPAVRRNADEVVIKIGMPHFEAQHEAEGLRFWDGDPCIRLLEYDASSCAMLLEKCEPGTPLSAQPQDLQDEIIADILDRAWRAPLPGAPFRPLSAMIEYWCTESIASRARWTDPQLVQSGLNTFADLISSSPSPVVLFTDLHAGNVLAARRAPWLATDPKPFAGDRAYDVTQHLLNCRPRLYSDADAVIESFCARTGTDTQRARRWLFARAAAEPRDDWDGELTTLARTLRE